MQDEQNVIDLSRATEAQLLALESMARRRGISVDQLCKQIVLDATSRHELRQIYLTSGLFSSATVH